MRVETWFWSTFRDGLRSAGCVVSVVVKIGGDDVTGVLRGLCSSSASKLVRSMRRSAESVFRRACVDFGVLPGLHEFTPAVTAIGGRPSHVAAQVCGFLFLSEGRFVRSVSRVLLRRSAVDSPTAGNLR